MARPHPPPTWMYALKAVLQDMPLDQLPRAGQVVDELIAAGTSLVAETPGWPRAAAPLAPAAGGRAPTSAPASSSGQPFSTQASASPGTQCVCPTCGAREAVEASSEPRVSFGRCKGQLYSDMWSYRPDYCRWVLQQARDGQYNGEGLKDFARYLEAHHPSKRHPDSSGLATAIAGAVQEFLEGPHASKGHRQQASHHKQAEPKGRAATSWQWQ